MRFLALLLLMLPLISTASEDLSKPILTDSELAELTHQQEGDIIHSIAVYRSVIGMAFDCIHKYPDKAEAIASNLSAFTKTNLNAYLVNYKLLIEISYREQINEPVDRASELLRRVNDSEFFRVTHHMTSLSDYETCNDYAKSTFRMQEYFVSKWK